MSAGVRDPVAFLQELVARPSPSGEEAGAVGWLVDQMTALGFRAGRDAVGNAVGEVGPPGAERLILLLGHVDTVAGDVPVRRVDGRLYGRGTVDAKGPLAAFVLAAARVAPHLTSARVRVVGAVGEEARSRGARHLVRTLSPPACVIVGEPSGWAGITLGYKGVLLLDYRRVQPAGHSAGAQSPPAEAAVAFWNRLVDHVASEPTASRFRSVTPALRSIHTFGDGLEVGVEMRVGLRVPPGWDADAFRAWLRTARDGAAVEIVDAVPAYRASKNTPPVRALLRAIRAAGGAPRFTLKTGTADMNIVGPAWGCPCVTYGPGDSTLDHTPDEHVEVAEYLRGIDVLTRALTDLVRTTFASPPSTLAVPRPRGTA